MISEFPSHPNPSMAPELLAEAHLPLLCTTLVDTFWEGLAKYHKLPQLAQACRCPEATAHIWTAHSVHVCGTVPLKVLVAGHPMG